MGGSSGLGGVGANTEYENGPPDQNKSAHDATTLVCQTFPLLYCHSGEVAVAQRAEALKR